MKKLPCIFVLIVITLFFLSCSLFSQSSTFQLSYTSGTVSMSYSAEETMDRNGYFFCGNGANWKYTLAKTDYRGKVKWGKTYSSAAGQEYPYCTRQTSDSGFIMLGIDENNGFGSKAKYLYIVKADKSGNLQWAKTYDVPGATDRVSVISYSPQMKPTIQQTKDGGFIFATTFLFSSNSALCVFKADVNGNLQWVNKYNISGGGPVVQTTDNGYMLAGVSSTGVQDACLIKINASGVVQWSKTYGIATDPDIPYSIIQTKDKGYLVTGYRGPWTANDHDMMIFKTDSSGIMQWEKIIGFANNIEHLSEAIEDVNGDIIAAGFYSTVIGSTSGATYDSYLTKLSPTGNFIWQRTMNPSGSEDRISGVSQASNGNYIFSGATFTSMQLTVTDTGGIAVPGCKSSNVSLPLVIPTLTVVNPLTPIVTDITSTIVVVDRTSATIVGTFSPQRNVICIDCNLTISPGTTICPGNSVTLTAGGSSSYYWSTSTGSATSPTMGTRVTHSPSVTTVYTVFELDCFSSTTTTVTVSNPSLFVIPNYSMCQGYSQVLSVTGATNYIWSPAASLNSTTGSVVNSSATTNTTYTIIGTAPGGCGDTATINLAVHPSPVLSVNASNYVCNGSSVTLTTGGANNYLWNTGSTTNSITVSPTSSVSYSVTGTDNNGCTAIAIASVSVIPIPQLVTSPHVTICNGDSVILSASGASSYVWSNGASTASHTIFPTSTNSYLVSGVDVYGCGDTATVNVTVSPKPVASIAGTNAICVGGTVTLTAAQAAAYQWSGGQSTSCIFVSPTTSSNYFVTVWNGSCFDTASFFVDVNSLPVISVSRDTGVCFGNSIVLNANGSSINYVWLPLNQNGAGLTIAPTSTMTYSVIGTDNNGCSNSAVATVSVFPIPVLVSNSANIICSGNNTILSVSGANNYLWNNGASTSAINVSPSVNTIYSVKGTTQMGCTDSMQVMVTVNPKPELTVSNDTSICEGEYVILSAYGGDNYYWNNGQYTATISVSPNTSTIYNVVTTLGNCSDTAEVSVNVVPLPVANAGASVTILQNTSITLHAGGTGAYQWKPLTGLSCNTCADPVATPSVTTAYYLIVTDETGCSSTDSMIVYVEELCGNIFIPNVFSPNGDGNNDNFMVMGNCIKTIYLAIYDRWGEKVFESNDITNLWDGTFRGDLLDTDVFSYKAVVTRMNDETIIKSANVSLIR